MKVTELIDTLDNDEQIIDQQFDGLLIWPTVRIVILQYFIDKYNKLDNPRSVSNAYSLRQKLTGLIKAFGACPFWGGKISLLIFNTSTSNIKDVNGKYFNRIVDYFFYHDSRDVRTIEDPIGFCHLTPRSHKTYSKLWLNIFSEVVARFDIFFSRKRSKAAYIEISNLLNWINRDMTKFEMQMDDEVIRKHLVKSILRMKPNYYLYKYLFKSKDINMLIIEDGYYGLEKASLIRAAKDLKVKVVEPQHGFINQNHPAYNYGSKISCNDFYKKYMPDTLFCYGQFWANSISVPNEKYILGNPHLEESLKKLKAVDLLKQILVLGSGVTVDETKALLNSLLEIKSPLYNVVYRPHPQEFEDVFLRYGELISKGVKLDLGNLYESIAQSEIILGELTTTIFEAIALKKRVYLYDSSYTRTYFNSQIKYFKVFSLANIRIIFENYSVDDEAVNYYWRKGWEESYRNFIKKNKA